MKTLILLVALCLLPLTAWAVPENYSYSGVVTSDTLVKTGSGVVHTLTCGSDAAATAGTLSVRDGVAAGGGTIIATIEFVAAYFPPVTLTYDAKFGTGLFLDFTTTADVSCTVTFK
jgi:hypothetical protein